MYDKSDCKNVQVQPLTTVELISQQALEISRLNYANSRLSDDLADTWHPEFGSAWRLIGTISELLTVINDMDKHHQIKCIHNTVDIILDEFDPTCLNCELTRVVTDAKNYVKGFSLENGERLNDETSSTNP